ncbi:hypothetical protein NA57DRAFT_77034 [Rhizodiscina lignyota]|uniref:Tat pathway signal sequence n=1 Tax=Rhizodiscina lignyota TaxID=1504668 RepID=A0A9P4IEL8_9PEZI|nr:hypothetical protein NA57DRAFT_77034 [Rhizodiscina lignyota]
MELKADSRKHIDIVGVQFTGDPSVYEDGTLFTPNPGNVTYTGEPSPEIDAAWLALVGGRDFLISEEEAKALWTSDYELHWDNAKGGYYVGLSMFHTLHCLARIYQYFHAEHYGIETTDESIRHRNHCIDEIRQYVMCTGDITVYGTRYYKSKDRNFADSDVTHVCRDFGKIREWVRRRRSGDLAVQPDYEEKVVVPADHKRPSAND